ncbi:hypothetical protein [Paenibacillus sp.]|uniref:hypothetical protein n=1 Tax=Paenibacillus sp. TaxID=58172 RepID=UPI002D2C5891|nr:hypothetical protein [Paenibacillus sp.]HZG83654.1 hypothetical protein [Paenibacillus sp.]
MERRTGVPGWAAGWTLTGAAIVALASALHPLTLDPWHADLPIRFIAERRTQWVWDHALMAVGIVLWLGGLAIGFGHEGRTRPLSFAAAALSVCSIAMWLTALSIELGGLPIAVDRIDAHEHAGTLAASLFANGLLLGYFAMIPAWLAVALGSGTTWGALSGALGIAGIVFTLFQPIAWVLALTSALPFGWTILAAWRWRSYNKTNR